MHASQVVLGQCLERGQVLSERAQPVKHSLDEALLQGWRWCGGGEERVDLGLCGLLRLVAGDEGAARLGVGAGEEVRKEAVEDDQGGSSLRMNRVESATCVTRSALDEAPAHGEGRCTPVGCLVLHDVAVLLAERLRACVCKRVSQGSSRALTSKRDSPSSVVRPK